MTENKDQALVEAAKQTLDEAERGLGPGVRTRLRAAREQALAAGGLGRWWQRPQGWLPLGAMATAVTVLAIAAVMWLSLPRATVPELGVEDIDLLAAQDSIDFYSDLDFYYWLATMNDAA
ncbi:MAG: hypothetical protein ACE5LB_01375 [Acidiferrobacterales bacterium]